MVISKLIKFGYFCMILLEHNSKLLQESKAGSTTEQGQTEMSVKTVTKWSKSYCDSEYKVHREVNENCLPNVVDSMSLSVQVAEDPGGGKIWRVGNGSRLWAK